MAIIFNDSVNTSNTISYDFNFVQKSQTDTNVSIRPGVFYKFPEMETLSVSFVTTTSSSQLPIYSFSFISGDNPTNLIISASDITWQSGGIEVLANKTYEISILDGLGVMVCA